MMMRRLAFMAMTVALLIATAACGSEETAPEGPLEGVWVGRLLGEGVGSGVVVRDGEAAVFLCGDGDKLETHSRWMRGQPADRVIEVNGGDFAVTADFTGDPAMEAYAQEMFEDFDLWQVRASDTYAVMHFLQRWLDRHGSAPGPDMIGELAQVRTTIEALLEAAEAGQIHPIDNGLVQDILASLPDGMLGLEAAERQDVVRRFAGMDWGQAADSPVYPVLFCLRRLAELHTEAGSDDGLTGLLRFLAQQIEALEQKLLGSRKAQAAA